MATMSGRGVITSRTSVSPKSTIDCSSAARPLRSAAVLGRLSSRAAASRRCPRRSPLAAPFSRSARLSTMQPHQASPVSGWRKRAATSNGGSSTASTRSGLRRTMSNGSTCSQIEDEDGDEQRAACRSTEACPSRSVRRAHRRQREDEAEHEPRRDEQLDGIVEVVPEAVVAAAALGHQAERQPHQRAERRLDVPT